MACVCVSVCMHVSVYAKGEEGVSSPAAKQLFTRIFFDGCALLLGVFQGVFFVAFADTHESIVIKVMCLDQRHVS